MVVVVVCQAFEVLDVSVKASPSLLKELVIDDRELQLRDMLTRVRRLKDSDAGPELWRALLQHEWLQQPGWGASVPECVNRVTTWHHEVRSALEQRLQVRWTEYAKAEAKWAASSSREALHRRGRTCLRRMHQLFFNAKWVVGCGSWVVDCGLDHGWLVVGCDVVAGVAVVVACKFVFPSCAHLIW